jgi:hypothetical protein
MWPHTIDARFYPLACVCEIAAALIPKMIKGTIAKQAIEIIRVICLMARKILALSILKIFVMFHM